MKIAIIGTGIAGNVAARELHREHDITVFEANSHVGGHTHTHDIEWQGRRYAIDTGFIVFNYRTYPQFTALLGELGVAAQPSDMSFSVRCDRTGLEYNGTSLNALFAQRRNLLRPSFYRMLADILRFNREAVALLAGCDESTTLGELLRAGRYGQAMIDHYLVPMGAAIWSTDPARMFDFPAAYFIRFLDNHGLLSIDDRPVWQVIRGGSREYVRALTAPFASRIRTAAPVESVRRFADHVEVTSRGRRERFDAVFIASHSDQALAMLADPSPAEREVLGAIPYQENEAVLHVDDTLLPRRRLAWAAWNYHLLPQTRARATLTYNMNILQGLDAPVQFCVTLNHSDAVRDDRILKTMVYHHPVYTPEGVAAQSRQREINGTGNTYYCGAYWRFGFHEDGVVSARRALQHFEEDQRAKLYLPRTG